MRHFIALALLGSTLAATVQAAPWIDDRGRLLTMQFAGAPADKLAAAGHDADAAAAMFKGLCLDTGLDRETAGGMDWSQRERVRAAGVAMRVAGALRR